MSFNRVLLTGILTQAPEVRDPRGAGAQMSAEFGVAVSRTYRTPNGNERHETMSAQVQVYGPEADRCRALRGDEEITLEGRLRYEQWREGALARSRYWIQATRIDWTGAPEREVKDRHPASSRGPAPERAEAPETPLFEETGPRAAESDPAPITEAPTTEPAQATAMAGTVPQATARGRKRTRPVREAAIA